MSARGLAIQQALATAMGDAAQLHRFIAVRERYLETIDWMLMSEQDVRESSMMDDHLEAEAADAALYLEWLEIQQAQGVSQVAGLLRFAHPCATWHSNWALLDQEGPDR